MRNLKLLLIPIIIILFSPNKHAIAMFSEATDMWVYPHNISIKLHQLELNKQQLIEKLLPKLEHPELQDPNKLESNLNNLQLPNEAQQKRAIHNLLQVCAKNHFLDEASLAASVQETFDALPYNLLENSASKYFSTFFLISSEMLEQAIVFSDKRGGDQLGRKCKVTPTEQQLRVFHIKTHRQGLKSGASSGASTIELNELLIYKILELSGMMPQVHFFYDDARNFYIATLDAGFDEGTQSQLEFLTYDIIKNQVTDIPNVLTYGFIKADILSRLLVLSDVLNNGGNTGVIITQTSPLNGFFKIIDFNPPITQEYLITNIYNDWLSGNNKYNYSDEMIITILKNKIEQQKINEASGVMEELDNFQTWVEQAYTEILRIIEPLNKNQELSPEELSNFERYKDSIVLNFQSLTATFHERRQILQ